MHFNWTDPYREGVSLLHRLDPRTKVGGAVLFILTASLLPAGRWAGFGLLLLLIVGASLRAGFGPAFTLRRGFIALPFALAALPLPFTMPGPPLFEMPLLGWTASQTGVVALGSVMLRTWLAVQAAVLLTATTPFPDILWSLGTLRVPRPLVSTIGFMYRYLFVMVDEAARLLRARAARSARPAGSPRPPVAWQGRVAGGMVGSLFVRSLERSERVYAAMLARGYDGRMLALATPRMAPFDWTALALTALTLLAVFIVAQGIG